MSGHHPLCPMGQDLAHRPRLDLDEMQPCLCPVIAAVEALVREQIAKQLEQVDWWELEMQTDNKPGQYLARIARGGDRDG